MLILALKRERKRTCFGAPGHARDAANTLAVRPSIIVDQGLCEVISIGERLARDARRPDVNRVEADARIRDSIQPFFFFGELTF